MPFAMLQAKRLRIERVTVGTRRDPLDIIRAIETQDIVPTVDRSFALDRLVEVLRLQQSGGHFGKICLTT